jgi:hypothetical protein
MTQRHIRVLLASDLHAPHLALYLNELILNTNMHHVLLRLRMPHGTCSPWAAHARQTSVAGYLDSGEADRATPHVGTLRCR